MTSVPAMAARHRPSVTFANFAQDLLPSGITTRQHAGTLECLLILSPACSLANQTQCTHLLQNDPNLKSFAEWIPASPKIAQRAPAATSEIKRNKDKEGKSRQG
ncbi:unnamed protein product [Euphydryas editha]|uniref:Uncharacterized protein n=1 Tax=Euphydryas editha TaxID=104508 RepID=A0AAU9TGT3_EUPED|nr:unnamed protein product [Euphydryas editha]